MTIKEAQARINEINKECAIASMNKDWTKARELNDQAIKLQNELFQLIYGKR